MTLLPALSRRRSLISLAAVAIAIAGVAGPASARSNRADDQDDTRQETTRRQPGQPMLAVVSLGDQRVTIYDKDGAIMHGPISSGATPNDTPPGIYAILQKNREHYSNRYDDAAMPFMQRITWTGIALHAGALPGYPASHGCVRLRHDFANQLFDMTKLGMRVVVSRNNMVPVPISHPNLFKPKPFGTNVAVLTPAAITIPQPAADGKDTRYDGGPNDPPYLQARATALQAAYNEKNAEAQELGKKADAAKALAKQKQRESAKAARDLKNAENAFKRATGWLEDAERTLSRAKSDKAIQRAQAQKAKAEAKVADTKAKLEKMQADTKPALEAAQQAADAAKFAEDEKNAAAEAARDAERKLSPVSVFISRKTGKLYIRQAFDQIYEGDVFIRDPDEPIGTYTYTALDYKPGGREMLWNVVSIAGRQPGEPEKSSGMNQLRRNQAAPEIPTDVVGATAALDRIEIPQETRERIAELVLPGSSLIISDEAAHKETGKHTDFIVLLSGEPQGGIILRPKPKQEYYDDYWGGWGYNNDPGYGYDRRRRKRGPFGGPGFAFW
ncbi:L,D-transpeptidase family protein [Hyphomicrobium sp. NDB2Meth4]|uniref:L,D-transpeptidase family protein n=1 Tax=Hyphomicrobium sp. NDB2Meth4 TaxID=1892846 RepID=UPI0009307320|nr:L,D-transpeptidase family protein [Hyphomicrobium sp. NDB2Meth4]